MACHVTHVNLKPSKKYEQRSKSNGYGCRSIGVSYGPFNKSPALADIKRQVIS